MRKPIVMLSDTSQFWELTGPAVRADGWWGSTDGIHTVSVQFANFVGGFKVQGTLALEPAEADWFDIDLSDINATYCGKEVRYPRIELSPTGTNGGDTGIEAFTFVGNFTHLRALVVRDFLGSEPTSNEQILDAQVGQIIKVLLSL